MPSILSVSSLLALVGTVAATTYDASVSTRFVYYSAATYCKESTLTNWGCGPACQAEAGVTHVTPVGNSGAGTFSYVAYNPSHNEIVVAFRGSHNIENWISNIDFKKQQLPGAPSGVQVHTGFYQSYLTMQSGVLSAVKTLLAAHPSAQVAVTGHSLGAAQATFAFIDIKTKINPGHIVFYSFGSPRPGNQAFSDYVMTMYGDYKRVVHLNDCVPHVPLTAMGFNHAGEEVWYNDSNNAKTFKVCTNQVGKPENPTCSDTQLIDGAAAHKIYMGIQVTGQCTQVAAEEPETRAFLMQ